jgi:anti-sigma regulatory factor (Ser/Thr protein kinase)
MDTDRDVADALSLSFPAEAVHVETARLFAAAAARHLGLSDEAVEDLKLVVSELCADAVEGGGSQPVEVSLSVVGAQIAGTISGPRPAADAGPVREGRRRLVEALVTDLAVEEDGDGAVITFRIGPASEVA